MRKFTDDGETFIPYNQSKRKNEELQREHELKLAKLHSDTQKLVAIVGLVGAFVVGACGLITAFVPIVSLPSSVSTERQTILEVLIYLFSNSNNSSPEEAPTSSIQTTNEPRLIDSARTGEGRNEVYTLSLNSNQMVVGDAHDVENRNIDECVVFWKKGPVQITFTVQDGAWYQYTDVETEAQADQLLQDRYNFLAEDHWFCSNANVQIVELGE